jgi:hypothetical protein
MRPAANAGGVPDPAEIDLYSHVRNTQRQLGEALGGPGEGSDLFGEPFGIDNTRATAVAN